MLKLGVQLHLTPALSKACHPQSTKEQCPIYTFSWNSSTIITSFQIASVDLLLNVNKQTLLKHQGLYCMPPRIRTTEQKTTHTIEAPPHQTWQCTYYPQSRSVQSRQLGSIGNKLKLTSLGTH